MDGVRATTEEVACLKIVLDAGHGGKDPGAVGYVTEKEITLKLAKLVAYELRLQKHEVIMTRSDDVYETLAERVRIANEAKPDLFVSIHCNAATSPNANGVETLCYRAGTTATNFANRVQNELAMYSGLFNRGVKLMPWIYVLKQTTSPAILVELGFVSNKDDAAKLKDPEFIRHCARLIARGITK